jgi:hypothetical protein
MYYGYIRESAKYRTEWICICKSENRKEVSKRLRIESIKNQHNHGFRTKIVKGA